MPTVSRVLTRRRNCLLFLLQEMKLEQLRGDTAHAQQQSERTAHEAMQQQTEAIAMVSDIFTQRTREIEQKIEKILKTVVVL